MGRTPWQTFCWFVSLLSVGFILAWYFGAIAWFFTHYKAPETLAVSAFVTGTFLLAFVCSGFLGARALQQEMDASGNIADKLSASNVDHEEFVRRILTEANNGPSHIRGLLRNIHRFVSYRSQKEINAQLLVDAYAGRLFQPIHIMERRRSLLFVLGLLGTILGIVYALASATSVGIPQTPEDFREFGFVVLGGLGIAYTSSLFGMGGALVLQLLGNRFETFATNIEEEVSVSIESILLVAARPTFSLDKPIRSIDEEKYNEMEASISR